MHKVCHFDLAEQQQQQQQQQAAMKAAKEHLEEMQDSVQNCVRSLKKKQSSSI
jgi:vacuolar-type H+-ATPase subunit E/Vma4